MKSLQEKQYIRQESGKRYGKWEVLSFPCGCQKHNKISGDRINEAEIRKKYRTL
jgi:hypothetical protein